MKITEEYREQNRQLHENPSYGVSGRKWAGLVNDVYTSLNCDSVLDYGCGKQTLGAALPHLMIRGYDPAIEGLDAEPEPADLVICGDVMEHVEIECVDDVLDDLQRLGRKAVVLIISTQKAIKTLPDGRNAHITIRPSDWWLDKIRERWHVRMFNVKGDDYGSELVCLAKPLESVKAAEVAA